MINLSKRLTMVANMVTRGNRVADIGCDHAHTSIYLVENHISDFIIAMDINEGPIKRAQENIERYGCTGQIVTRLCDGAEKLKPGETDTLLLSGMGGGLMVRILTKSLPVVEAAEELVLQPQSELSEVRKFLHGNGFSIAKEDMLTEDGKHYTAIKAQKGREGYDQEVYYQYGKYLLENQNPSLLAFLKYGEEKFEKIIANLEKQEYDRNKQRLLELRRELSLIKEALTYYRKDNLSGDSKIKH